MPRRPWTEAERGRHSALMKRLHRQRPFNCYRLSDEVRVAVAAALQQQPDPNASRIARQLDVSPSYVCTVARAERIPLRIGRRYDRPTVIVLDLKPNDGGGK